MIKNTTPYLGNLFLQFDKYPYWGSQSKLNKVHLDLGFTKLVSRIKPLNSKIGWEGDPKKIEIINQVTGGEVKDHWFESGLEEGKSCLRQSFLAPDGTYIGDLSQGWWYVKNNLVVEESYPHGVAKKINPETKELEGYYGYSHRGGSLFKIGDRLFDEKYEPQEKDYPEWQWAGWVEKFNKSVNAADEFDRKYIYNEGMKSIIPFRERGKKVIETWEEAKQAAINMSKYLS